jgi:predicted glycogen debranching enzyme
MAPSATLPHLRLEPQLCHDFDATLHREWLVTNGLGGYASGTVAGVQGRRYHGLLIAALAPPLGRTLLVSKLDATVHVGDVAHLLHANVWRSGPSRPNGVDHLAAFELVGGVPTWQYELPHAVIEQRIWMEHGENTTYVQFTCAGRAARAAAVRLAARVFVNYRDYHSQTHAGDWRMHIAGYGAGMIVRAFANATPVYISCAAGTLPRWTLEHVWWRDFYQPLEAERGFDAFEDHLNVGVCEVGLRPDEPVTFVFTTDPAAHENADDIYERQSRRSSARLDTWRSHNRLTPADTPAPLEQLALAAHQFIVRRPVRDTPQGHTLIAGYPWFGDWGRDTMIALPGLTLVTGRADIARQVLLTWSRYVRDGLIPNRFPDAGDVPEYHTADATLWYLWAIDQYLRATDDEQTLAELLPVAETIVACHRRGTRHNIRVAEDGLIYAGHEGINLTWMDAKIGDRVITPRTGKPVELSALWYYALCALADWSKRLKRPPDEYVAQAKHTRASFAKFWNPQRSMLYDVIDGPGGFDGRLLPNQIFAAALDHCPLPFEQRRAVVDAVAAELLIPYGLRTLAPDEPGYRGHYTGGPVERDEAYHTGTAWGWLLGPFAIAHFRVYKDAVQARAFLEPMFRHLLEHGVGSLSEVFDGDAPHHPGGTYAQAWSVAETLRAWHALRA